MDADPAPEVCGASKQRAIFFGNWIANHTGATLWAEVVRILWLCLKGERHLDALASMPGTRVHCDNANELLHAFSALFDCERKPSRDDSARTGT
jgi:hypothetical protein